MAEELESSEVMMKVVKFLSTLLQRVAETNDVFGDSNTAQKMSIFQGLARPTISVQSYLERIFKYANCSPSCFIVAYIYLDRFAHRQTTMPINSFNVHRLLIASVLISAKFMDDIYYNNAYYAKVGGISTREMNLLEVDFLFGLSFQLNVSTSTFHYYCNYLQREMQLEYPPFYAAPSNAGTKEKLHFRINEEVGSTTHQHQLAV